MSNPYGLVPVPLNPSSATTSALYGPYSTMSYASPAGGTPAGYTYSSPYSSMATGGGGGGLAGSTASNGVSQTATIVPLSMSSPYTIMASPMPTTTLTRTSAAKASQMALAAAAAAVYSGGQPLYLASPQAAMTTYGYDASGFAYAIPVPVVPTYIKR